MTTNNYFNYRNKVVIILFILFNHNSISQEKDTLIIWSENYKLSWKDFLGNNLDSKEDFAALSSLELRSCPSYYNSKIYNYVIISTFNRYNSISTCNNSHLLKHEQIHFDIQEIFARKIRKRFLDLKNNKSNDYLYFINFKNYKDSLDIYQEKYDKATNYSLNSIEQKYWENIVKLKLKELESYSLENLYNIK